MAWIIEDYTHLREAIGRTWSWIVIGLLFLGVAMWVVLTFVAFAIIGSGGC